MNPSYGEDPLRITDKVAALTSEERCCVARIEILNFKRLCDLHGHAVSSELPGLLSQKLGELARCRYVAVLGRGHLTMRAALIAVFDDEAVATELREEMATREFDLSSGTLKGIEVELVVGETADLISVVPSAHGC